jgi:hypothetical protein
VKQTRLTVWTYSALLAFAATARAAPPDPRPYHVSRYDVTLQPDLAQRLIRGLVTLDVVALEDNLAGIDLDASDMMIIACGQGRQRFHLRSHQRHPSRGLSSSSQEQPENPDHHSL